MRLQSHLFWLVVLVTHAGLSLAWLLFMPGGFPLTHPRTLSNRLLPLLILTLSTYALARAIQLRPATPTVGATRNLSSRLHHPGHTRAALLALATFWLTTSLTCLAVYPVSSRYLTPPTLVLGLLILLSTRAPSLRHSPFPRPTTYTLLPLSLLLGTLAPLTQRAPAPDTHPLSSEHPTASHATPSSPSTRPAMLPLSPGVRIQPSTGELTLDHHRYFIHLQPLLTFISRSPDRCWIAFAPRPLRNGPQRRLTSYSHIPVATTLTYQDDTTSTLLIPKSEIPNPQSPTLPQVTLESTTTLPSPIFSHLNTYTELLIAGHTRLFLEFSPCPGHLIEVTYQDYPAGRPARLAYVAPDRSFHIVQATTAEKGPYHPLGPPGTLPTSAPLTITFHTTPPPSSLPPSPHPPTSPSSSPTPFARLTLHDFSPQLSTQLSPTAGHRLPVNSIEFSLQSDKPNSAAALFLSLASTSPGRGYDTVGHSPGTYRNRLDLQFLPPPQPQ